MIVKSLTNTNRQECPLTLEQEIGVFLRTVTLSEQ